MKHLQLQKSKLFSRPWPLLNSPTKPNYSQLFPLHKQRINGSLKKSETVKRGVNLLQRDLDPAQPAVETPIGPFFFSLLQLHKTVPSSFQCLSLNAQSLLSVCVMTHERDNLSIARRCSFWERISSLFLIFSLLNSFLSRLSPCLSLIRMRQWMTNRMTLSKVHAVQFKSHCVFPPGQSLVWDPPIVPIVNHFIRVFHLSHTPLMALISIFPQSFLQIASSRHNFSPRFNWLFGPFLSFTHSEAYCIPHFNCDWFLGKGYSSDVLSLPSRILWAYCSP